MTEPKDVSIHKTIFVLASGAGISQIGNMVYLLTVNVFVFEVTHCALAVSGLWMVSKIAALIVGPWAGSLTDRLHLRAQLVTLEIFRAGFIALLPFCHHAFTIYLVLFMLGSASTFFNNVFLPYYSTIIPSSSHKKANAAIGTLRSGAMVLGPAIAGVLLAKERFSVPFDLDAARFVVSALSFSLLPTCPQTDKVKGTTSLRQDWHEALDRLTSNRLFFFFIS